MDSFNRQGSCFNHWLLSLGWGILGLRLLLNKALLLDSFVG